MQRKNGYHNIADELRRRITDGRYAEGSLLPPERKLCDEWQVERTTLRRALALLSDEGLIIKKSGYGSVVAARSNAILPLISFIAFSPSASNSGNLGSHHFLTPVYEAFSELCAQGGYRSISMMIAGADRMASFETALKTSKAVVLADNVPDEFLRRARELNFPCVLMSERALGFRSVLCDNDNGLLQVVRHLTALGHKHIVYIGGDRVFLNSQARADGFRRAMFACGLDDIHPVVEFCGWNVSEGFNCMEQLLNSNTKMTAVCAVNDHVALGAYRAAVKHGLRVPEDISIVGFGNTMDEETTELSLSTVQIPYKRFARELYRSLLWEMEYPYEDPAAVLVEAELLVRNTSAAVKNI